MLRKTPRTGLCALLLLLSTAHAQPTTTIIAHGFSTGSKGVWVQAMAQAILARAGEGSLYRYEGSTGRWTFVPTASGDGTNDVVVLIFNWVPESDGPDAGPNWNYVQAAGDALHALLRDPSYTGQIGPASLITDRSVHFIGHSRGACVMSETIRRLALANVPVDQFTALDAHPVNGTLDSPYNFNWGDPVPQKWNNLAWADNYWRADGGGIINGLDFDGIPIPNVFNNQLSENALNCCAYPYSHLDVHLWYHGTIDLGPNACDGEHCITPQMRSNWWPAPPNPGHYTTTGFYHSQLGGGAPQRPPLPAGIIPTPVETVFNGSFEQGSRAGWSFHGGAINGQLVNQNGNWHARIGPGQGRTTPLLRHNRFFVPSHASTVVFDYRIDTPARRELLDVIFSDKGGQTFLVGAIPARDPSAWIVDHALPLACAIPRGRSYTLTFRIAAAGTATAVIAIDNVRLGLGVQVLGDANSDGMVNVNDLLLVINQWGPCDTHCVPASGQSQCAGDVTDDCAVNVNDLLAVINFWNTCP